MFKLSLRLTVAGAAGAALLAVVAPVASAHSNSGKGGPPGDNGTVKVHRSTTSADKPCNQPHVCEFYLVGFKFDGGEQVSWWIESWPRTGDKTTVTDGTLTLGADGHGRTEDMRLPDGHYKLFWTFAGEHGKAKHKVFWVKCPSAPPTTAPPTTAPPTTAPPTSSPTPPSGSPTPSESSTSPGSAPVPTPVHTQLPVTG